MKKVVFLFLAFLSLPAYAATDYVRVNQVGYFSTDSKIAVAFSNSSLSALTFSIINVSGGATVFGPTAFPASSGAYSPFTNTYKLDFSTYQPAGPVTCYVKLSDGTVSPNFVISGCVYQGKEEMILNFYLAQRCGTDNKYAGAYCHMPPGGGTGRMDGKVADGPHSGTLIDTEGGWHDSGDFIKFMITTGWSCECMLAAYRDNPSVFQDNLQANGTAGPNGLPDVLDEAKYALDWIIKMNPDATTLYYQVGGAADHNLPLGALPQNDNSAYSTNPYRPVYEGTHEGGSNNCGKAAACLALAYQIWNARGDTTYANTCLTHAQQIYAIGKAQAYNQPANPASYYTENGFNDDMEWAAAELYRATGTASYLTDAKTYATAAGSGGGALDWATSNFLAHYSLYPLVDAATQTTLKGYMQSDVNSFQTQSTSNVYALNTAYNWGSMETMTGGILEGELYDKLFGVTTYENMATYNRDFLLGKNPWGVSFIVGMGSTWGHHPQHNIAAGLGPDIDHGIDIPGMPIEGPDTLSDWTGQGITLDTADIYAPFQATTSTGGVYHDDVQDYATNEPTSTHAGLCIYMFSNLGTGTCSLVTPTATATATKTATATASATPTFTATKTATGSMTATPSFTATPSATPTRTGTATATSTVGNTSTSTPTATATLTSTSTSAATATATFTPTGTPTRTSTFTPTPTSTSISTNTVTSTATKTSTLTPTDSFTPTETSTVTDTPVPGATATPTATPTATRTSTSTVTVTATRTSTATSTSTGTATPTRTATPTASFTATNTAGNTSTATLTSSPTATPTVTSTETVTDTPVPGTTPTATTTPTGTASATASFTATLTPTASGTASPTRTATFTATPTASSTGTATPTKTVTVSATATASASSSLTATPTKTATPTATLTMTPTSTDTANPTATASPTPTSGLDQDPVIYPNPLRFGDTWHLHLFLSQPSEVKVRLFTLAFRKINGFEWKQVLPGTELDFEAKDKWGRDLADGLYYLEITVDGKKSFQKLLVLR